MDLSMHQITNLLIDWLIDWLIELCLVFRFKLIWGYADGLTSDTTRKQTKNKYLQTLYEVKSILLTKAFVWNGAIDLNIVWIFDTF